MRSENSSIPTVPRNGLACSPRDEAQQPRHALVAEVLDVGGVRVERLADVVVAHRRPDAHARVQPAARQDVDGREILGQPQRVLPAQRDDGRSQRDPPGALGGGGEHGDGGGDAVLQVPVAHPGAVEAELLAQLDDLQGRLVPGPGSAPSNGADGEEAQLLEGHRRRGHGRLLGPGSPVVTAIIPHPGAGPDSSGGHRTASGGGSTRAAGAGEGFRVATAARREAALASSRKRPTSIRVSAVPVVLLCSFVLGITAMPPGERSVGDVRGRPPAPARVP